MNARFASAPREQTRGFIVRRHGGPEVLEWTDPLALPRPCDSDLVVRQSFVGLNFFDVYSRRGDEQLPLPSGIGIEAGGTVEWVGSEVRSFQVGDRVAYAPLLGAYQEHRVLPASRAVLVPEALDLKVVAASMVRGMTAYYLLHELRALPPGTVVLYHAAAGGLGLLFGQWANHLGLRVIGTASSAAKRDKALQVGYERVLPYGEFADGVKEITSGHGVTMVVDSVAGDCFSPSLEALAPRGLYVALGAAAGPRPPVDFEGLAQLGSLFITRPTLRTYTATGTDLQRSAARWFDVLRSGAVRVGVDQEYPLRDAAEAHRALEARETVGAGVLVTTR
ncbi:MAG: quinone oxidoreductase [Myxococcota bacterium]